jgi:hypothetical protein
MFDPILTDEGTPHVHEIIVLLVRRSFLVGDIGVLCRAPRYERDAGCAD